MLKRKIPVTIVWTLFAVIVLLTFASLLGQYYKAFVGDDAFLLKIVDKFDLDLEKNNIPTWYQSSTLLVSSLLLLFLAVARKGTRQAGYWAGLAAIFLFLSIDEAVSIHEQLTMPLRTAFDLKGVFYLSWIIPAGALSVVFAVVFFRFLKLLPRTTRWLLVGAGIVYVSGALGVEMIGANYLFVTNDLPTIVTDFRYVLITTCEEFLEMSGIAVFLYALLCELVPVFETISENAGLAVVTPETNHGSSWQGDLEQGLLSPNTGTAE